MFPFQHVFNPKHTPTLAYLALIQPLGAIMPIAEMQARWITQASNLRYFSVQLVTDTRELTHSLPLVIFANRHPGGQQFGHECYFRFSRKGPFFHC